MSQSGRYIAGTGAAPVETLTGNTGGPVAPDGTGNINVLGSGLVAVAGNAGTNTLTITVNDSVAASFVTDSGTAIPVANTLDIIGGSGITTSAVGNNITITSGVLQGIVQLTGDNGQTASGNNVNILGGTNITTSGNNVSTMTISALANAIVVHYTAINAAASPYTVLSTDYYIGVDSTGGAVTVRLPNAPTTGRIFVVKDVAGTATVNNITVTTVGGVVLIDGAATFVIVTPYQASQFIFNGTKYESF